MNKALYIIGIEELEQKFENPLEILEDNVAAQNVLVYFKPIFILYDINVGYTQVY